MHHRAVARVAHRRARMAGPWVSHGCAGWAPDGIAVGVP